MKDKTFVKPSSAAWSILHIVYGQLESVKTMVEQKQPTEEELELKEKLREEKKV